MIKTTDLFVDYFEQWIHMYKEGSIRQITLDKYYLVLRELRLRWSNVRLCDINHFNYQQLINDYALTHEFLTVKDFHHHCKAAMIDALDDGLIKRDPTRHLRLIGKNPSKKKAKFLSLLDLKRLLRLVTAPKMSETDLILLLIAKTGLRYAEALGLTRNDFDFDNYMLTINKTWNYKAQVGSFQATKNKASVRVIDIDPLLSESFDLLTINLDDDAPIFVSLSKSKIYLSTVNNRLAKYCQSAGIDVISVHGLRHTHASLLMYDGVSISSVAKRLGHSNTVTTQHTYLHIVKELEARDNQKIMDNMLRLS